MRQAWTTNYMSRVPLFAVDPASLQWDDGHQINWDALDERYQEDAVTIKLAAAVSADDVSMTVDALTHAIPKGVALHFGQSKELVFTTDVSAVGDTSIAIEAAPTALEDDDEAYWSPNRPGKIIRAGTVMTLEGGYMIPRALATSVTLTSLSNATPVVATLTAHGFGDNEIVRISGVTTQTNSNNVFEIEVLSSSTFQLLGSMTNGAAGGTIVAVRAARGLLGSDARENDRSAALSGRGLIVGGIVYRNLLVEKDATAFPTYAEELAKFGRFQFRQYVNTIS